jgi:hypothetical protein
MTTLAEAIEAAVARTGFVHLSDLAARKPEYEKIVRMLAEGAAPALVLTDGVFVSPQMQKESQADWQARVAIARDILFANREMDVRVNACPHRGCRTGCGQATCNAGRGDMGGGTLASISHCRSVVAECEKMG